MGDTLDIGWIAIDDAGVDSVSIDYSLDNGAVWTAMASGEPNDSLYSWVIPGDIEESDSCLVRVTAFDPSMNTGAGVCAGVFAIEAATTDAGDTPALATALRQNYPNPFNGHTTIVYSLERGGPVDIRIYDTAGRLIRILESGERPAGAHEVVWNGKDDAARAVASGVYFVRMSAGDYARSRKIVYLR